MMMSRFINAAYFGALIIISSPLLADTISNDLSITITVNVGDEEFVGPFPSWACVRSAASGTCGGATAVYYNAVGNGVVDDTTAIQNCLTALGSTIYTCYFPAGTYKITSQLTIAAQQYVNLIGEDPSTTAIIWAGSSGGGMLFLNGVAYSRVHRLTFNGQGTAGILVNDDWNGTGVYFNDGNSYADDVFKNGQIGFQCAFTNSSCSGIPIIRSTFQNNTTSGLILNGQNALAVEVWYSRFISNHTGAFNPGGGNFQLFYNIFQNQQFEDIFPSAPGIYTFRGNYSIGAGTYFIRQGGSGTSSPTTVQGNTVLDTGNPISMVMVDQGLELILDNVIRMKATNTSGPIVYAGCCDNDNVMSLGNVFGVPAGFTGALVGQRSTGRLRSFDPAPVGRSTINPSPLTLPGTPPNFHRAIFEASASGSPSANCSVATPCTIQHAIDIANASVDANPVVHIQPGSYSIATTLTVPANRHMQIVGDGVASGLSWSGGASGTVLQLTGPSKAVVRELALYGNNRRATCLLVTNADQPGSRVFVEQPFMYDSGTQFLSNGLHNTNVELHSIEMSGGGNGLSVVGGGSFGGSTNLYGGNGYGNAALFALSGSGKLNAQQYWNDGGSPAGVFFALSGTGGTFSMDSIAAFQYPPPGRTVFSLNNFTGTSALVNVHNAEGQPGYISYRGVGSAANNLVLGFVGGQLTPPLFSDTTSPVDTNGFLNGAAATGPGTFANIAESGVSTQGFLTTTLAMLRANTPTVLLNELQAGVTDVRIYRVRAQSCINGIDVEH